MAAVSEDTIDVVSNYYLTAKENEKRQDWDQRARQCNDFVAGFQWNPEDVEAMEEQGAVALTVNHCLPIRDNLCGREVKNRKDIKVRAVKNSSLTVAELLTRLTKNSMDGCGGNYEKSVMFRDGVTLGKGWLFADVDYENDPDSGEMLIEAYSPFNVKEDPFATEYDFNKSGMFVTIEKWVDKDKIHAFYPDKVDELGDGSDMEVSKKNWYNSAMDAVKNIFFGDGDEGEDDEYYSKMRMFRYPLKTTYYFKYKKLSYWIDKEGQKIKRLENAGQIKRARESVKYMPERFVLRDRLVKVLHRVKWIAGVELEHVEDPFKCFENFSYKFDENGKWQIFTIPAFMPGVRFCPYFENGNIFGKIDNLIGPQKEENKRRTQFLRILNSMANSGWMFKKGSLSEDMKDMIEMFGSRPGIMVEYTGDKPDQITPQNPPQGHLAAAMASKEDMKEISSVNNESLAYETPSGMSGYAIALKQQEGMVGNEIVFDNFDKSSMLFGNILMNIIRSCQLYSLAEIEALVDDEDIIDNRVLKQAAEIIGDGPQAPPQPDPAMLEALDKFRPGSSALVMGKYGQAMKMYEKQAQGYERALKQAARNLVLAQVEYIATGNYSVKVSQSPNSPTMKMANFAQLLEVDRIRPNAIPARYIIEASDLPHKDEIIAAMDKMQQNSAM